jgi:hypothetical protein
MVILVVGYVGQDWNVSPCLAGRILAAGVFLVSVESERGESLAQTFGYL